MKSDKPTIARGGTMDKPDILLVEDESELRELMANRLQAHGARVWVAEDDREGVEKFYQYASSIDALVTDMRLRSFRNDDFTGGEMARKIKSAAPDLPMICVSAIDARLQYPFFDMYFIKGAHLEDENFFKNLPAIIERALAYENARFSSLPESLISLKQKYQISDSDFFELVGNRRLADLERTALLLYHRALESTESVVGDESETQPRGPSEVEFVEPGSIDAQGIDLQRAVPIVLERSGSLWVAELFGFPLIYTYADDRGEAIHFLVRLLHEYKTQISTEELITGSGRNHDHIRFAAFLSFLFA